MLRRLSVRFLVASLALLPISARGIEIGDPAPEFALVDVGDVEYRLSDYRGQVVLVAFVGYN